MPTLPRSTASILPSPSPVYVQKLLTGAHPGHQPLPTTQLMI